MGAKGKADAGAGEWQVRGLRARGGGVAAAAGVWTREGRGGQRPSLPFTFPAMLARNAASGTRSFRARPNVTKSDARPPAAT